MRHRPASTSVNTRSNPCVYLMRSSATVCKASWSSVFSTHRASNCPVFRSSHHSTLMKQLRSPSTSRTTNSKRMSFNPTNVPLITIVSQISHAARWCDMSHRPNARLAGSMIAPRLIWRADAAFTIKSSAWKPTATQESHQSCVEQVAPLASSVLIAAESKPMKANLQAPVNNSQYTKSSLPTFRSTSKPAGRPQVPPRLSRHLGMPVDMALKIYLDK
mmetsp:Transcript_54751/g.150928  ORF Transcript_54751/g.150928 Transcript_54751/m.150928 type:complete len:218 (+) Transcript_54751:165-818(+)